MTAPARAAVPAPALGSLGGRRSSELLPTEFDPPPSLRLPAATRRRRLAGWRVATYLLTVWLMATVVFALPRALPGDPLAVWADDNGALAPERRAAFEEHYRLDRPLLVQYREYLVDVARLDFGQSIQGGVEVSFLLRRRLPWTLLLVGTALLLSSLVSFLTGVTAAWRRGTKVDRRLLSLMTVVHSVPAYVTATLLFILFAVVIPLFPQFGASTAFTSSAGILYKLGDVTRHLVLPATALALWLIGTKFLLVRNTTIGVLGQDYMVLARAKGLPERLQKYRHAGRNALLPFVTAIGLQSASAMGAALFVEAVFGYPGIASLMLPAVEALDYPVLEACFLVAAVVVLTVNLVLDLTYARLDPRVGAE